MEKKQRTNLAIPTAIMLAIAAVVLFIGWKNFWFLTDDAYIDFRYASNSILGFGYTWNPPPFRPVEGYTSFLWVIILEYVWRIFGILPPNSANNLSFGLSFLTLALSVFAVSRLKLATNLEKHRLLLIGAVLLGLVTNRTFLTWSSSGLETALFNFCFFLWVVLLVFIRRRNHFWLFGVACAATSVYLVRPDGILVVGATAVLVAISFWSFLGSKKLDYKWFLAVSPLLLPLVHLGWRRSFYGEWLPNTYYAKYVAPWPASGIRYLAAFMLEYGLWVWLIILAVTILAVFKRLGGNPGSILKAIGNAVRNGLGKDNKQPRPKAGLCTIVATITVALDIGYYTFVIGGDHFEWRVYSYTLPLIFISFFFLLNILDLKPARSLGAVALLLLFSLPIPWAHFNATKQKYAEKRVIEVNPADTELQTVTDQLPIIFYPLTKPFDELQRWLIQRHVCVRWIEHDLFWQSQLAKYPSRSQYVPEWAGKYPVAYFSTVGVPGWVLPTVAIIDGYGLNDYIIARHATNVQGIRRMAHDRYPPEGYAQSFFPNVKLASTKQFLFMQRPPELELTADKIVILEKYWDDKIIRGKEEPPPAFLPPSPKLK